MLKTGDHGSTDDGRLPLHDWSIQWAEKAAEEPKAVGRQYKATRRSTISNDCYSCQPNKRPLRTLCYLQFNILLC